MQLLSSSTRSLPSSSLSIVLIARYHVHVCRSVGVVLYVFLSGVSPFLDDSDEETRTNIATNDYSFPDEYFLDVSPEAQYLISRLLVHEPVKRLSAEDCAKESWIKEVGVYGLHFR